MCSYRPGLSIGGKEFIIYTFIDYIYTIFSEFFLNDVYTHKYMYIF